VNKYDINPVVDENLYSAMAIVSDALGSLNNGAIDHGVFFEDDMVDALTLIYECDQPQYQRIRVELKNVLSISAIERLIKENTGSRNDKPSQADELVNLVKNDLELFHDEEKIAFATIHINGHEETYLIDSSSFYEWLSVSAYKKLNHCPSELTIRSTQQTLSAMARFEGKEIKPFLRVANYKNGYVIDIGDCDWRVIVISPNRWEIRDVSPVKFWRNNNMRSLPIPNKNGSLKALWELLNIQKKDKIFILNFIFECWRNDTEFPILELIGEQGTAKSTTQSILRKFIDPNKVALRAAPKNIEDLFVSASQNWLASYNNLSYLKPDMQDAFCILSTGGGHSTRKLYTNNEESVIDVSRPCIINGISGIATAQDLLDRVIRLELQPIKSFTPQSELDKIIKKESSGIFGGLLDRFCKVLSFLPKAQELPVKDRMADFVKLGEALCYSFGKQPKFEKVYRANKTISITQAIEASPAIMAIDKIVRNRPFNGTYARLLSKIKYNYLSYDLPKSAKGLADLLKRQAPALRKIGIKCTHHKQRKNDGYHVSIQKI